MNALLLFFRPIKVFGHLKTNEKFPTASMVILLFLMLINLILMIPINEKITEITFSSMGIINESQLETMLQVSHKMRYLQVAGTEILYIGMLFFYAFLLYLSIRISKSRLDYKKSLQLFVYSYFIIATGDLVNTVALYTRGLDTIKNLYDTSLVGINLLTTIEQMGATGYTFLCYINPFQLGFVCMLSIGLKILLDTKWLKAIIVCTSIWLITILIPVISVYLSQLTLETKGIL
jgi:hypothetical protein